MGAVLTEQLVDRGHRGEFLKGGLCLFDDDGLEVDVLAACAFFP
jgi:hypothetical protein